MRVIRSLKTDGHDAHLSRALHSDVSTAGRQMMRDASCIGRAHDREDEYNDTYAKAVDHSARIACVSVDPRREKRPDAEACIEPAKAGQAGRT